MEDITLYSTKFIGVETQQDRHSEPEQEHESIEHCFCVESVVHNGEHQIHVWDRLGNFEYQDELEQDLDNWFRDKEISFFGHGSVVQSLESEKGLLFYSDETNKGYSIGRNVIKDKIAELINEY